MGTGDHNGDFLESSSKNFSSVQGGRENREPTQQAHDRDVGTTWNTKNIYVTDNVRKVGIV
jgi:hypothetical protein